MTLVRTVHRAISGWMAILRGDSDWRSHFTLSRGGLYLALAVYLGAMLILLAVRTGGAILSDPLLMGTSLVLNALPVAALGISVLLTGLVLRWPAPAAELMVPGTYALAMIMVLNVLLLLFPAYLANTGTAILGVLIFRLGRTAWLLPSVSALAFAVLTVVLLVGLPVALYMLTVPFGTAPPAQA